MEVLSQQEIDEILTCINSPNLSDMVDRLEPVSRDIKQNKLFKGSLIVIEKIEQTLDAVIPFVILFLSVLQLTGIIEIVDRASPVIYGALATLQAVFKIWGRALRYKEALC
jgi:hypothetical protein